MPTVFEPQFLSELHKAARAYAHDGYQIFPLSPGTKVPFKGSSGFKEATTDLEQIDKWWTVKPTANIGISTGDSTGRVVLDVDVKDGAIGMESLADLQSKHGPLQTLIASTPSGGWHYYFKKTTGCPPSSNQAATLGLDLKSNGGYVVAPPSVVDGKAYLWEDTDVPIAAMPEWLPAVFTTGPAKKGQPAQVAHAGALAGAPQGSRNQFLFAYACSLRAKGMKKAEATILVLTSAENCDPPLPQKEALKCLESAFKYADNYAQNDLGNADRFVWLHAAGLRHVTETGHWYKRQGQIYERLTAPELVEACRAVISLLVVAAGNNKDNGAKAALRKFAKQTGQASRLKAMIDLAAQMAPLATPLVDLDSDPWLAGTDKGVIDLRTGTLVQTTKIITKRLGASVDPKATCPNFLAFLHEIFEGNAEMVGFLQRIAGYLLTGSTEEHAAFWLHGPGANGKSVLVNILQAVLGDYAVVLPANALQHTYSRSRFQLGHLPGARLARVSEVGPGFPVDEALLKDLTGGDPVTCELKFKDPFKFEMTAKLMCATNHLPSVAGTDHGFWRRQYVIPLNYIIPPEQQDRGLENRIRQHELSGVLNWMIVGLAEWLKVGLSPPEAVLRLVAEYRQDEDPFANWFEECCTLSEKAESAASVLYGSYETWANNAGEKTLSKKKLGSWLKNRKGLETNTAKKVTHYVGVSLKGLA